MKLYICYGTFKPAPRPGGHPCGNAHEALTDAGYEPELIRSYGFALLPGFLNQTRGRREVKRLTGNYWVPVLVTDDNEVIQGSDKIIEWAKAHPAPAANPAAAVN
jgi:glutathione S-transferase-like protein